jgi:hypothetical protein
MMLRLCLAPDQQTSCAASQKSMMFRNSSAHVGSMIATGRISSIKTVAI